jgi:hypothetical protein
MTDASRSLTRGSALKNLLTLPALAAAALAAGATGLARADSRADLKYQSTPNNGQHCSDCALFVPGKTATDDGTCKVIPGSISPNGWCVAFSKKPS